MDPEYIINRDDIGTSSMSTPLLDDFNEVLNIRGGGEQTISESENSNTDDEAEETRATRCSGRCRNIPTLVWIIVPIALIFIAQFLAAAFMPHTVKTDTEKNNSTLPPVVHNEEEKALHSHPIRPTLLSIRDYKNGELVDVHTNNYLYNTLKYAIFDESSAKGVLLQSNKNDLKFGDSLTLKWDDDSYTGEVVKDDDIIALYCPSNEVNPKNFKDAATVANVKVTHRALSSSQGHQYNTDKVWHIPSFPIIREDSCEFRMYSHSKKSGGHDHHYTLAAKTDPISLSSSSKDPTGVHISVTGKVSEMVIQFATVDSGKPIVKYAKKSDLNKITKTDAEWTTAKGDSTTYAASDMCQPPATSTDPGHFTDPGHLHTVKLTDLQPRTEYEYRVGLSFGQGIKWSDKSFDFRTSSPPGVAPQNNSSHNKPVMTFLAVADLGVDGAKFRKDAGPASPNGVTKLISSIVNNETIDAVHLIGDLAYAHGSGHLWDAFQEMIQPYASRVPTMVAVGNHEYDHNKTVGDGVKDPSGVTNPGGYHPNWGDGEFNSTGGECGVPVSKRFAAPDNGNGVFWYSFDQSLVHTTVISGEHNLTKGSPQHNWLKKDLASVNRTITPWLVVETHRPIYNSETHEMHKPVVQLGLQNSIEDLLHEFQVDVVIGGHYHSYFRSCDGLYEYKCDSGGPTYITAGTGGAPLDGNMSQVIDPHHYTMKFDKSKWGVARASVYNSSMLYWEFVAVDHNKTLGSIIDKAWIIRYR